MKNFFKEIYYEFFNGWQLIKESIVVLKNHPIILLPLLICWVIYASIIIYLKYFLNWDNLSMSQGFLIIFIAITTFAAILAISGLILLELIQQSESGEKMNLIKAITDVFIRDVCKAFPIIVLWAIIWFLLTVISILLSKNTPMEDEDISFENVASTLAGYNEISMTQAFINSLNKGIRMVVFLTMPAIAWDDLGTIKAAKKSIFLCKIHMKEFAAGYVITLLAATIIFLPTIAIFYLSDKFHIFIPDFIWFLVILYSGFAWSFSIFLEQMFAAELYLRHLIWEKECKKALSMNKKAPKFKKVRKPLLFDNIYDLKIEEKAEKGEIEL